MTPLGWFIMIVSLAAVIGLTTFCLLRVLQLPAHEVDDLGIAPLGIETPDTRRPD